MSAGGETAPPAAPHIPVLLDEVMEALAPIAGGIFIDGTFGAGATLAPFWNAARRR